MKKGFTLIEIVLALGLSTVVFLMMSAILVTVLNSNTKNTREEAFEQAKNNITVGISNEIRWAEDIEYEPGNLATLTLDKGKIKYAVSDGKLTKNGDAITPENVKVTKFTIENRSTTMDTFSLVLQIEMENKQISTEKDRLRIVASQRRTEQEVSK